MDEFDETHDYGKNFLKSKTTKIVSSIILAIIIIGAVGIGVYRHEKNELFYNINSNIANLNATVVSMQRGLNTNEESLNPTFAQNYESSFSKLASSLTENESNILNTQNSKAIVAREAAKAQYYDYMAQFIGQSVSYKADFQPLENVLNNGGSLTSEQAIAIQNDLTALENSKALTDAMNLYNNQNTYLSLTVKSPYVLKQQLINFNNAVKNGEFNSKSAKNSTNSKSNNQGTTQVWFTNFI